MSKQDGISEISESLRSNDREQTAQIEQNASIAASVEEKNADTAAETSDFYAYLDRMKFIRRWQLMRCTRDENIMEHSQSVALFTHALCVVKNRVFGGKIDEGKAVLYAVYHETAEVMTGDLPTPVKYYNRGIHGAYKDLETLACEKITATLPPELREGIAPYVFADENSEEYKIVKAADRLSAYVKCLEELRCGNNEFLKAKASIEADLHARNMPEVEYFFSRFVKGFSMTLDELESL